MKEILTNDFTTEDYVKAIKSGKRFLQKQTGTNANQICFMQDPDAEPIVGKAYSSFEITECKYDAATDKFYVGADLELTQTADITVDAELIDLEKGTVYAAFGQESAASEKLNYQENVTLSKGAPVVNVDLAVVAVAKWRGEGGAWNSVSIVNDLRDYEYGVNITYPKKETGGYIEFPENSGLVQMTGDEPVPEGMDPNGRGEKETINIALFRKPDDVSDMDYLCMFGKDTLGNPYFTVPSKGTISIKNLQSGKEIVEADATCYIHDKSGTGGYYLVASSSGLKQKITVTIGEKKDSISYDYTDKWDNAFFYGGGWQKYYFSYILQIELTIVTQGSGTKETQRVYVATQGAAPSTLKPDMPYITVMWGCVAEGTHIKVNMDGNSVEKEIQEITAGDIVDLGSGRTATVKEKWRGPSDNCVIVRASDRTLKMSKDHPVMTAEGWKRAEKLKITDEIMDATNTFVRIDSIETDAGETQTYNLEYVPGENARLKDEEYMIAEGFVVGNMRTQNSSNL